MRALVIFAVIIGSGFAIPIETIEDIELHRTQPLSNIENIEELQRWKKSYSAPASLGAPCAGAAPYAPISLYLGPSQPQAPQYREDEHEEETKARAYLDAPLAGLGGSSYGSGLSTSIIPSGSGYSGAASGSYGVPASGASYSAGPVASISAAPAASYSAGPVLSYSGALAGGHAGAPAAGYSGVSGGYGGHGSALGIFPNAHLSGCNVPLLLSCAPSVVSGHLAQSHGYAHPAPAYRSIEELEKEEWMQARKASHHKVSEDFPEPHPGNHHVVSQDYPEPNLTRVEPHAHVSAEPAHKNKSD